MNLHYIPIRPDDPEAGISPPARLSVVPAGPLVVGESLALITRSQQRGTFRVEFLKRHWSRPQGSNLRPLGTSGLQPGALPLGQGG